MCQYAKEVYLNQFNDLKFFVSLILPL